jgi:hypothetical protein
MKAHKMKTFAVHGAGRRVWVRSPVRLPVPLRRYGIIIQKMLRDVKRKIPADFP